MKVTVASVVALLVAAFAGYLYGRKSAEKEGFSEASDIGFGVFGAIMAVLFIGAIVYAMRGN